MRALCILTLALLACEADDGTPLDATDTAPEPDAGPSFMDAGPDTEDASAINAIDPDRCIWRPDWDDIGLITCIEDNGDEPFCYLACDASSTEYLDQCLDLKLYNIDKCDALCCYDPVHDTWHTPAGLNPWL